MSRCSGATPSITTSPGAQPEARTDGQTDRPDVGLHVRHRTPDIIWMEWWSFIVIITLTAGGSRSRLGANNNAALWKHVVVWSVRLQSILRQTYKWRLLSRNSSSYWNLCCSKIVDRTHEAAFSQLKLNRISPRTRDEVKRRTQIRSERDWK